MNSHSQLYMSNARSNLSARFSIISLLLVPLYKHFAISFVSQLSIIVCELSNEALHSQNFHRIVELEIIEMCFIASLKYRIIKKHTNASEEA